MQRYEEFAEVITATQKKRRYSTMYYPNIDRKTSDIHRVSKASDRLDLLATEYYGDPRYWVIIAKANKLHAGTIRVPVGIRLRIPYPLDSGDVAREFTIRQF